MPSRVMNKVPHVICEVCGWSLRDHYRRFGGVGNYAIIGGIHLCGNCLKGLQGMDPSYKSPDPAARSIAIRFHDWRQSVSEHDSSKGPDASHGEPTPEDEDRA